MEPTSALVLATLRDPETLKGHAAFVSDDGGTRLRKTTLVVPEDKLARARRDMERIRIYHFCEGGQHRVFCLTFEAAQKPNEHYWCTESGMRMREFHGDAAAAAGAKERALLRLLEGLAGPRYFAAAAKSVAQLGASCAVVAPATGLCTDAWTVRTLATGTAHVRNFHVVGLCVANLCVCAALVAESAMAAAGIPFRAFGQRAELPDDAAVVSDSAYCVEDVAAESYAALQDLTEQRVVPAAGAAQPTLVATITFLAKRKMPRAAPSARQIEETVRFFVDPDVRMMQQE